MYPFLSPASVKLLPPLRAPLCLWGLLSLQQHSLPPPSVLHGLPCGPFPCLLGRGLERPKCSQQTEVMLRPHFCFFKVPIKPEPTRQASHPAPCSPVAPECFLFGDSGANSNSLSSDAPVLAEIGRKSQQVDERASCSSLTGG